MVCDDATKGRTMTPQDIAVPMRFRFCKLGRLKYISHLDVNRTLQRALMRAKIPLRFTEGFNPHPRMVFALPLAVGVESHCEYLDTVLSEAIDPDEAMRRLNRELPEELQISETYTPCYPFKKIGWAGYELTLEGRYSEDFSNRFGELLAASPLAVVKRTKSGENETDISPYIRRAVVTAVDDANGVRSIRIAAVLCADNTNFLNPIYLVRAAERYLSMSSYGTDEPAGGSHMDLLNIKRNAVFLEDGVTEFR